MRFSLNFIKEFLEVKISPQKLASLLTMAGVEVEHYEPKANDWVFDIEVTSNRYDLLSVIGIARELSVILGKSLKLKYPQVTKKPLLKGRLIKIESKSDCLFYVGRAIRNITVQPSPPWLKERVLHCNISSINNIVDITNYCMLKWGNPLHAFDEDKLEGNVYIRRAEQGEVFIGIDEKERKLTRENLIIADDKKVIALAGLMGAKNTEVDHKTKNVFLEAALFSPLTIRRSRRLLGLDTQSSYRFERRVFGDYLEYTSSEAASLMQGMAGGKLVGYKEAGKKPAPCAKKIILKPSHLDTYAGDVFPYAKIKNILTAFGFTIVASAKDRITVRPPPFRFDIEHPVDVYEELLRIFGYDKLKATIPAIFPQRKEDLLYEFNEQLRDFLAIFGLREIITYSIEDSEQLKILGERGAVRILNPLRQNENMLRQSLLLGMLKCMQYNLNRNQASLRFFEIAHIYHADGESVTEVPALALGLSGEREALWYLKAVVEGLLNYLRIPYTLQEGPIDNFTNALHISVSGKAVGFLGKLNTATARGFDLSEEVFFSQLDVALLYKLKQAQYYRPFSFYPIIFRDISIALRKDKRFKDIEAVIQRGEHLYEYRIIDFYKGKDIAKDYCAFTIRIFYQAKDKTLTSQEVDSVHKQLREGLKCLEGVILR